MEIFDLKKKLNLIEVIRGKLTFHVFFEYVITLKQDIYEF